MQKSVFYIHFNQPRENSEVQNFILLSRNTKGQYQLVEK